MAYDHRRIGPSLINQGESHKASLEAQVPKRPTNFDDKHIPASSSQHVIKGRLMNSADYD